MSRTKLIEDNILLELIKKYFDEECHNDLKKLKAVHITKYINNHGYPDYRVTTLRRTAVAVEYIEELKKIITNDNYVTVASYQTIDAAALVDSNRSRSRLIKSITERDAYYKKVADSAIHYLEKYDSLQKLLEIEKTNTTMLTEKITELEEQLTKYKAEVKTLSADLKACHSVIDTYIYPEIANELLVKEGAIRKTENFIKTDTLDNTLITPTTNIKNASKSGSNIIKGLFNLEE